MLTFEPPELKNKIAEAIQNWERITELRFDDCAGGEIINPNAKDFSPDKYVDWVITLNEPFSIRYPYQFPYDDGSCDLPVSTYGEFIELTDEIGSGKLFKSIGVQTSKRLLVKVASDQSTQTILDETLYETDVSLNDAARKKASDLIRTIARLRRTEEETYYPRQATSQDFTLDLESAEEALYEIIPERHDSLRRYFPIELSLFGQKVVCALTRGITLYGLVLLKGKYDERFLIATDRDLFIEARYEKELNEEFLDNIVEAYIFELSSSLGITTKIMPFQRSEDSLDGQDKADDRGNNRIRPLLLGNGLTEPLRLYNEALNIVEPDVQILFLAKVIEYISRTVIRQSFITIVRAKLLSPSALEPTAQFIMELNDLMDEQKQSWKDKEAVKLTVKTCCEATELAKVAPRFLPELSRIAASSKRKECESALEKLGEILADTRNSIAHAKANYSPTGNECPPSEMKAFSKCVQLAAQQALRWYGSQSEIIRVT